MFVPVLVDMSKIPGFSDVHVAEFPIAIDTKERTEDNFSEPDLPKELGIPISINVNLSEPIGLLQDDAGEPRSELNSITTQSDIESTSELVIQIAPTEGSVP